MGALVLDTYVSFGLTEILVPFTGTYRPAAVAWGIIATYLLLAVEATSLLRQRISRRVWRWTHSLSFALFGLSTVHSLTAGTHSANPILRVAMLATSAAVVGLTAATIDQHLRRRSTNTPQRTVPVIAKERRHAH
ncbi:MAG: hypothetical protein R2710_06165 [Acidimicrobiales bacterium]